MKKPAGITLATDAIDETLERAFIDAINHRGWTRMECGKDVQEFGYDYHFRRRCGHDEASFDPVASYTKWLNEVGGKEELDLKACPTYIKVFSTITEMIYKRVVNQIIVNHYPQGEGIRHHTDKQMPCQWFVSLSLGNEVTMDFRPIRGGGEYSLVLPRRSLLLVEGEAFHDWKHGIDKDAVKGAPRISITGRSLAMRHFKGG